MSVSKVQDQLMNVILASLPEQTSGAMKSYIEQAEKDKQELERAKQAILQNKISEEERRLQYNELEKKYLEAVKENQELKKHQQSVFDRELAVRDAEIRQQVFALQEQNKALIFVRDENSRFLATLVKNPTLSEYFIQTKDVQGRSINHPDGRYENFFGGPITEERKYNKDITKEESSAGKYPNTPNT